MFIVRLSGMELVLLISITTLRMISCAKKNNSSVLTYSKYRPQFVFNVNVHQTYCMYKYLHLTHDLTSIFQNFYKFSSASYTHLHTFTFCRPTAGPLSIFTEISRVIYWKQSTACLPLQSISKLYLYHKIK